MLASSGVEFIDMGEIAHRRACRIGHTYCDEIGGIHGLNDATH
jgi:hypothetical protein